jgi:hypothetical protein
MATDLSNLSNIVYIAFRLAPFLLVSFFTMSSVFNYEYKGLIYLVGLLLTTALAIGLSKFIIFNDSNPINPTTMFICNSLTLSQLGPISKIPLSILVSTYTCAYLLYFIYLANAWTHNISTYVIFLILIFGQIFWTLQNSCAVPIAIIASVIIGGCGGLLWGITINNMGISQLGFFNGLGNQNVCSIPKKQTFKCRRRNS